MHQSMRSMALGLSGMLLLTGCASTKWAHYGERMKLDTDDTVCVSRVLTEPEAFAGKHIRVKGSVSSVCAGKGCWIRLGCASVDETLYVKFPCPTRGRIVPMDAVGHRAEVEGILEIREVSEADARHLAKDEGISNTEIVKIAGPQKMIAMNSPGAIIDLKGPKGCQE